MTRPTDCGCPAGTERGCRKTTCPRVYWPTWADVESMMEEEPSAELIEAAEAAIERVRSRPPLSPEEWAKQMAADSVEFGIAYDAWAAGKVPSP